jgi:hypothetical protein
MAARMRKRADGRYCVSVGYEDRTGITRRLPGDVRHLAISRRGGVGMTRDHAAVPPGSVMAPSPRPE